MAVFTPLKDFSSKPETLSLREAKEEDGNSGIAGVLGFLDRPKRSNLDLDPVRAPFDTAHVATQRSMHTCLAASGTAIENDRCGRTASAR